MKFTLVARPAQHPLELFRKPVACDLIRPNLDSPRRSLGLLDETTDWISTQFGNDKRDLCSTDIKPCDKLRHTRIVAEA